MKMKKLNNLSGEELIAAIENNYGLYWEVANFLCEVEGFYVDEILSTFNKHCLKNYSFNNGVYASYMKVSEYYYEEFFEGMKEIEYKFCILPEDPEVMKIMKNIDRYIVGAATYTETKNGFYNMSEFNYERLEAWIESAVEILKKAFIGAIDSIYEGCEDVEYIAEEITSNPEAYENYYVNEEGEVLKHIDEYKNLRKSY